MQLITNSRIDTSRRVPRRGCTRLCNPQKASPALNVPKEELASAIRTIAVDSIVYVARRGFCLADNRCGLQW